MVRFEREISVIVVRGQDGALALLRRRSRTCIERHPRHQHGAGRASRTALAVRGRGDRRQDRRRALPMSACSASRCSSARATSPELSSTRSRPRVHNSGHWTLDACLVSQFENHIRAICGWPLGETARHSDAVMTNLIGDDVEQLAGARRRAAAPPSISTARPRRGPAARWATHQDRPEALGKRHTGWTTNRPSVTATAGCGTLTGFGQG